MAAEKLKKRAEFLAARKGRRLNGPLFFIEALERGDAAPARFGLTVTRKVGNAVERNRIRRRLREAIRIGAEADMVSGIDYVIVARRDVLAAQGAAFADLDGPLLLAHDRDPGLVYEGSLVYPARPELWG